MYEFLNSQEKAQKIAKEIMDSFVKHASKESVEYNFDIAKGTGKLKDNNPNTSFAYDPDTDSLVNNFKLALFNEDLDEIKDDEEQQLVKDTHAFLDRVKDVINTNHVDDMRDTIRRVVLPSSQSQDIPLNTIKLMTIEVIDYTSVPEPSKYLMRIGKAPDADVNTEAIIQFINACQEKSNKSAEEIFEEEKAQNAPLFDGVVSIESGKKYIFEVTLIFFVDYSLSQMPPKPPEITTPILN